MLSDPPVRYQLDQTRAYAERFTTLKKLPRGQLVEQLQAMYPTRDHALIENNATTLANTADGVFDYFLTDASASIDWIAIFQRLRHPHLVLRADPRRGGLIDDADVAHVTANPHAELAYFEACGHSIQGERPRELLALAERFLRYS